MMFPPNDKKFKIAAEYFFLNGSVSGGGEQISIESVSCSAVQIVKFVENQPVYVVGF